MAQNLSDIENVTFNFHKLRFTPIKQIEDNNNTSTILKSVIGYLNKELIAGRGFYVDRNANKKESEPRGMFMTIVADDVRKKRYKGTLALIRSGRLPFIKPADGYTLQPFDKSRGDIAEQTHFFIDYSNKDQAVICFEFNSNGPRISDFEFYVRKVAHDKLSLAKATTIETFMNTNLAYALENLANVLNLNIKIQPQNLNRLETQYQGYFNGMRNFASAVKPKFLKVEAMFRLPGKSSSEKIINSEATTIVKSLLKGFSLKQENIDTFDNFVVDYQDKEGQDHVFDLLKGKSEIIKEIDHNVVKKVRDWYEIIETDFDDFIKKIS